MSISANSLISDSINFFKNQLGGLSTIVLLATVVSVIIYSMMIPSAQMISVLVDAQAQFIKAGNSGLQDWVQGLSEEEKSSILRVSFGLILSVTFGSLILICGVLAYIAGLSCGEDMTGTQALLASLPKAPSMFLLLVVCSLLVQLGTTIMVFPGIILAIGFSLAPAILISENVNPFNAMGKSWKMAYANWRLALPMVLIWMASQMLVSLLMSSMQMNHIVSNGVSFLINNIIAAFALIYFYRLYMLITQK
ncbi:YciC family protein [Providencia manganoxydans]|uniref:YciC family protein n=1 Tax=Providencia manganoxydans TaxID=2923283 RepID=UPI0034DCE30B